MQTEHFPPNDPREWLNRAHSNLIRAKEGIHIPGIYLEDLCFDAQQAAEKAIKALLIHLNTPFPYVHDLALLLSIVEQSGQVVPPGVRQAARLTRYAVVTRYPGMKTEAHRDQQRAALNRLQQRLEQFEQDNASNPHPMEAAFRLDAGFGTYENAALLIEMGYEVYTKPHSH